MDMFKSNKVQVVVAKIPGTVGQFIDEQKSEFTEDLLTIIKDFFPTIMKFCEIIINKYHQPQDPN